jgi:uncharacterized protein (TIGR02145 family)
VPSILLFFDFFDVCFYYITFLKGRSVMENESKGTFTDPRDGKVYKTVEIGGVVWFAENLNFAAEGSVCYDNDPANGENYGRLYDWETAMKACPAGWHLASADEWEALANAVGNAAGTKLKSTSGWSNNGNGTDNYGFSALPGGYGSSGGHFRDAGNYGYWWSATESDANGARFWLMSYDFEGVGWDGYDETFLFSVRCVQDGQ